MFTLANLTHLLALSVILSVAQAHVPRRRPSSSPLVCHEDRELRALRRFSDYADDFCPVFLANIDSQPRWLQSWNKGKVSSACACYEMTTAANGALSTAASTPTVTGTAFLASSTAPEPLSEVFATSSATGGAFSSMPISEGYLPSGIVSGSSGSPTAYPSGSGASSAPYASGTGASAAPFPGGSGISSVPYASGSGVSSAPYPSATGPSASHASGSGVSESGVSSAPYPSGSGASLIPHASGSGISSRFMTGSFFGTAPIRTGRCRPSSRTGVYPSGTGQATYPSGSGITYPPYPSETGQPVYTSGTGIAYSSGALLTGDGSSSMSSHSMSLVPSGSVIALSSASAANPTIPPYTIPTISDSRSSLVDAASSTILAISGAPVSSSPESLTAAASSTLPSSSNGPDSTSPASSAATPSQPSDSTPIVTAGNNYPPQPPGGGPGKRGLCYDDQTLDGWSDLFAGSKFATYGSNGGVIRGTQLQSRMSFVPILKVDANLNNDEWDLVVPLLIEGSTKALFASNERTTPDQANLTPEEAATVYKKYMQPYAGRVQLGTPAITNDDGPTGLAYLEEFLTHCDTCVFNFINIHHLLPRTSVTTNEYAAQLKEYIDVTVPAMQARHPQIKGLPIFIGEWWLQGASLDEGSELMSLLLPYLDGNPRVLAYQAVGGLWKGSFIAEDGEGLTLAGKKYATWTSAAPTGTLVDEKDLN